MTIKFSARCAGEHANALIRKASEIETAVVIEHEERS
jgi:hypothetical protein